jgi:hypothetical protein
MTFTQQTKNGLLTASFLVLLLIIAALLLNMQKPMQPTNTPLPETQSVQPEKITVQGTYVPCLPLHDNFSKNQCIVGIKTEDGTYYALDFNLMSATKPDFSEGQVLAATGVFTPTEMLSSEQLYETVAKGILSVTNIENGVAPVDGKESATGPCYIGGCSGQICSGEQDSASTCEYREQYACYKKATCERQVNTGKCGWTPTPELNACLTQ